MNKNSVIAGYGASMVGLVFYAGQQSQRIDELFSKAHASSIEHNSIRDIIFDMHGKVCSIEEKINVLTNNKK
tara:strand:+ start:3278 stop:3493 length:216 start_codon:yes stop_codon:yes gene_type:complete